MQGLTTQEVARALGTTRQHAAALLKARKLQGEQLTDGRWIADTRSLNEYTQLRRGVGRNWSAESSWALLAELDGIKVIGISARTRARIRERIRLTSAEEISRKVATRSSTFRFSSDDRLATARELILTGRSATDRLDTGLAQQSQIVEGYLCDADLEAFAQRHLLIPDANGDVVIHDGRGVLELYGGSIGQAVIAADLARSTATREHSAGVAALEEAKSRWLAKHIR